KHVIKKGRNLINILSFLAAVWWGSHPQLLLTIYRAVFRGSIEYSCQVFVLHNKKQYCRGRRNVHCYVYIRRMSDYGGVWPLQRRTDFKMSLVCYNASLYTSSSNGTWFQCKPLGRQEVVLINRLWANHYNLNYSLFRKNMVDSPACTCEDPRQDANHIISHCPLSRGRFVPLNKFITKVFPYHSADIFPVLVNPQTKLCKLLLSFSKSLQLLV
ncbi:hypothetical protein ALC57_05236, partial [Trachymyrmex cornetzi]